MLQSWKQFKRDLVNHLAIHRYAQACEPISVAPKHELPNFCVDTAATQHLVPQTMSHWPFTNELNQACLDIGMSDGSTIQINGLKSFPGADAVDSVDSVIGQQEKHELYEVAAEYPLLPIRIS